MAISRRKFLTAGTLTVAYAGVPLKALANATLGAIDPSSSTGGARNPIGATQYLTRESFSRCLNTRFSFARGTTRSLTELIEVKDLSRGKEKTAEGKECFSLLFLAPTNVTMKQDTYTITHNSLGTFAALIVPIGQDKRGTYYEAVFNRLH